MEQTSWMWSVIGVWTTTCVGGFFFLNKRLNELSDRIKTERSFAEKVDALISDVHDIKIALKGDYEKKGLVSKHYDLERRVEVLEVKQ